MKKYLWLLIIAAVSFVSCIKQPILMESVVDEKARMDAAENPAMKFVIRDGLEKRSVQLYGVLVKDVADARNIDYDFCVLADVQTKKGPVECHIYSKDVDTVSKLVKGKSRIDVSGDFGKFFSLLGDYYTRLEIVKATITIK